MIRFRWMINSPSQNPSDQWLRSSSSYHISVQLKIHRIQWSSTLHHQPKSIRFNWSTSGWDHLPAGYLSSSAKNPFKIHSNMVPHLCSSAKNPSNIASDQPLDLHSSGGSCWTPLRGTAGGQVQEATVKFVGATDFAEGEWLGVELDSKARPGAMVGAKAVRAGKWWMMGFLVIWWLMIMVNDGWNYGWLLMVTVMIVFVSYKKQGDWYSNGRYTINQLLLLVNGADDFPVNSGSRLRTNHDY